MTGYSETPLLVLDESSLLSFESEGGVAEELSVADAETTELVPVLEIAEMAQMLALEALGPLQLQVPELSSLVANVQGAQVLGLTMG